jgi:hypothetical protein
MKCKINLCIFNHPRRFSGILDQLWFARETFGQHGYELVCSNTLRPDCINLLIENFIETDVDVIASFCRRFDKKIGIVMTEHVELEKEGFLFAGAPVERPAEYIHNRQQRLFSLLSLTDCVFSFFTLGELPELRTWGEITPAHKVFRLPFPSVGKVAARRARCEYDIVFTGTLTRYRETVLSEIAKKYRVIQSSIGETEWERVELYARSKIAVNISQDEDWKWISPMRVLFGLRLGVSTVHLGPSDNTMFTKLMMERNDLDTAVRDYESLFQQQFIAYETFVKSEFNSRFPHELINSWGALEL